MIITFDSVRKGDEPWGAKMARRIARMIERRPDVLERNPDWAKYKDADKKMAENAQKTKEQKRAERPGPTHEELDQEGDESVKSLTTKTYNDTRQYYATEKMKPRKETKQEYFVGGTKQSEVKGTSATFKGGSGSIGGPSSDEQTNLKIIGKEGRARKVEEFNDEGAKTREDRFHRSESFFIKGKDGHVASVAVLHDDHILMGKRRDNGRWTLPGGHLEKDEDPHDGGKRELKEEAGIEADKLHHLSSKKIKTHTGKEKTIHAFKYEVTERPKTSMVADPDQEVERWQWIKHRDGLPKHVKENLHSPKNSVLEALCIKSKGQADEPNYYVQTGGHIKTGGNIADYRNQAKKQGKDFVHGGIASKQEFTTKEKAKEVEYSEEVQQAKSFFYVGDLLKSRPHKYIRKYKSPTGEWVYIYHEGDTHHRLTEEDVAAHRHLAEHGDEAERAHHHELVSNIETMSDEDIGHHRLLAEHGDEAERRHHKAILEAIGHKKSELERTLSRAADTDDADREMTAEQASKANQAVSDSVRAFHRYLEGYATTPIAQALMPRLREIGNGERGAAGSSLGNVKTVRQALKKLQTIAKEIEQLQGDKASSNPDVQANGGTYGNAIYNQALKIMASRGVIPQEYADEMKREARSANHEPKDLKGVRERAEQRKREEEAREARELGELRGSMAFHMASIMEGSGSNRVQKAREIDNAIKGIFGKSLTKEEWPYNFEGSGLKVKIKRADASREHLNLEMQVYDADGNEIMESWSRKWSKQDGRPHIYNSYMKVKSEYRGTAKVGDLINKGQRELMKRQPRGGVVEVTAALDVGGYNWANQGFSFSTPGELRTMRQNFQLFCEEKGVNLTNEDMQHFTEPVHFAAFNDGKKYVKSVNPYKLSPEQIENESLAGSAGGHPLTAEEKRTGKSSRMLCHLGKAFLLGRSWRGTWDSQEENATTRYADSYRQLRERAVKHLETGYQGVTQAVQGGQRRQAAPWPTQVTRRDSVGIPVVDTVIEAWTPRQTTLGRRPSIRMTTARVNRLMRMPRDHVEHFIRSAPLTPAARRVLRNKLAERGDR